MYLPLFRLAAIASLSGLFLLACSDNADPTPPIAIDIPAEDTGGLPDAGGLQDVGDSDTTEPPAGCEPGLTLCGTSCVDLDTDPAYCGRCDRACDAGSRCEGGQCVVETCADGTRLCDGHCAPCPAGEGITRTTCQGNACVIADCESGYELCGGECAQCPSETGSDTFGCDGNQCVIDECESGYRFCDGTCAQCPDTDPNGTFQCAADQCVVSCNADYHACSGVCVPSDAVDTCGGRCEPCPDGSHGVPVCTEDLQCALACNTGYEYCGDQCALCPDGQEIVATGCNGNQCVATQCATDYWVCEGGCCTYPDSERIFLHEGNARSLSIAIDAHNRPHVVISDADLRVKSWNGHQWHTRFIEDTAQTGAASIAIDANGKLFVAYHRRSDQNLVIAESTGASWVRTIVDDDGNVGAYTSLALNSQGEPRIAYHAQDRKQVRFASRDGGIWTTTPIHTFAEEDNGERASLVITPDDRAHILFLDFFDTSINWTTANLIHAYQQGNDWLQQQVAVTTMVEFRATSDAQGHIHASFLTETFGQAYGHWDGTQWATSTIVPTANARRNSIAVDANNHPHIVYNASLGGGSSPSVPAYHATYNGTEWTTSAVVSEAGSLLSLAIDATGTRHLIYQVPFSTRPTRGIYYARF